MRKLLPVIVLALVVGWLLSPGGTEFGCQASASVVHAADGSCPASLRGAATDGGWAAERLSEIEDDKITTGLFYTADGSEHRYESGEDDESDLAGEITADVGLEFPRRSAVHPASSHVEVKVAASMYDNELEYGVLVINNPGGVCSGRYSCEAAIERILPLDAKLVVWLPPYIQRGEPETYTGRDT